MDDTKTISTEYPKHCQKCGRKLKEKEVIISYNIMSGQVNKRTDLTCPLHFRNDSSHSKFSIEGGTYYDRASRYWGNDLFSEDFIAGSVVTVLFALLIGGTLLTISLL